ncbi:hypothetical protein CHS0354_018893 [Potamilus streckersoni]|uniref:Uncharacterized protein n=1 Tax=Potamilus streckersoni TaxID=2493646 RepID=A0AAE0SC86_9BIVA|nr:hypothetical protein CHS0354_018893 [Potamilus streckersoni]
MTCLHIHRSVVLILISTLSNVKGLHWCGTPGALETYGPDNICCNKKVHDRVDVDKRRRDCCSNLLYYTDTYECVDGELQIFNPPDPSPSAPTRPRKKVPNLRICEKHFVYRIRKIHMKNNSDQHIRATIAGLNLKKLNMTKHAKWWKEIQISINMNQSLYRKYVGKSFFVYSDKNLLWKNSLNLSSGDMIIRNKFRIRYIKKCSEGRIIGGVNVVN